MVTTTWDQKAGMTSPTDTDNLESFADQAKASKDAAAASETNAAASEAAASTSATNAATSETNAANSATASATSATASAGSAAASASSASSAAASEAAAATSEGNAATSASNAATSATNAATSETNASTSATAAASSASSASASADAALAALDSFDDRYLGQKASDPTVDNDGNPLIAGALYFNTTDDSMKVYDGAAWLAAYASLSGALLATNNLSDVLDAATARTNLGLGAGDTPTFAGINTTGNATFGDNDKAIFGTANDLEIDADSLSSRIAATGILEIVSPSVVSLGGAVAGVPNMVVDPAAGTLFLDSFGATVAVIPNSGLAIESYVDLDVTGAITVTGTVDGRDVAADGSKLDGIEAGANVTDTANVTAAGALMDSEVTNLSQVKAFDSSDYATAAQGSLADSALQSGDNVSALTNDAGYTTNVGDITNVSAGTGLSGGGASGSVTLNVDLSELTDMTAAMIGTDEFIVLDAGADRRKAANEIGLSIFSNDAGFTTNVGDITGVTAGTGLSGGGTSGSVTLSHADTSTLAGTYGSTASGTKIDRITVDANGHVTAITTGATGDIQGVTAGSGITGGGTSGTVTISHADTSSQGSVNNSGTTVIQDITLDTYGHITALGSTTLSIPAAYTNSDVDAHLNTGTATTDQVLSWNGTDYDWVDAGGGSTTAGDVGTYAFLGASPFSNYDFGDTVAGSSLSPAGVNISQGNLEVFGSSTVGVFGDQSGTWVCMGKSYYLNVSGTTSDRRGATLWLRIA